MSELLASPLEASDAVLRAVDRAISELRRGGIVLLAGPENRAAFIQAAEAATEAELERFRRLPGDQFALLLTGPRAAALGLVKDPPIDGVTAFVLDKLDPSAIAHLVDPTFASGQAGTADLKRTEVCGNLARSAIDIIKLARLVPALLFVQLEGVTDPLLWAEARDLLAVSTKEIADYHFAAAASLRPVSEAKVPLEGALNTRIVAFRPADGGIEHLAIVIGDPPPEKAALTRIHSECFTGDLLGSLRCDCGAQLRGAIAAISEYGSGFLIYLAQEGRGIGLVNKLRAYQLQDRGADTMDANLQLGYDADERVYLPAAEMLRQLGFHRIRLMTNNPEKVSAMTRCGLAVEERVPHAFPSNGHNEFYLATKAEKFGHLF